jgi:thiosulfate/3-mercaptopyruvate sulfurtransferase
LDVLADPEWLATHHAEVVVADVRWYLDGRPGRAAYELGHIPGAVFVDLDRDLSGRAGGTAGRHPLPEPSDFASAMGRLGIGDDDAVVAYDDSGGGTAGRLVWMLRVTGHDAALLDGGLGAWLGALETGPGPTRPAAAFTAWPWPAHAVADADTVAATAGATGATVVLDARADDRYRGETEPVDARPGHVPGARNAPWSDVLDPATGRFRTPAELRMRFAALGVHDDVAVIAYCGSGVSACADLLALEHAGITGAKLFPASWSGWSADPTRPAATGSA